MEKENRDDGVVVRIIRGKRGYAKKVKQRRNARQLAPVNKNHEGCDKEKKITD